MGGNQSCPNEHALQSIDIKSFDKNGKWSCDNCQAQYKDSTKRWRCIRKCNFDICHGCMMKWLPGLSQAGKRSVSSLAQDEVPHRHFLAPAVFNCDECKDLEDGDRFFCPKCHFNRCYGCAFKSILHLNDAKWKSMSVGQKMDEGESRDIYSVDLTMADDSKEKYVIKTWKPRFFREGFDMSEFAKNHMQAMMLSVKFNNEVSPNLKMIFKKPILHKMQKNFERDGRKVFAEDENILLEPLIRGNFKKFNSNSGWINSSESFMEVQAFTHFTWHSTKQLIVCNLQGVQQIDDEDNEHDGYYLSDAAICSLTSGKWGRTDLGPEGIMAFFKNHKCSLTCKDFEVPRLDAEELEKRRSRTYVQKKGQGESPVKDMMELLQGGGGGGQGPMKDVLGLAMVAALAEALKN